MPLTRFPHGLSSFGIPLTGGQGILSFGDTWFVDPANGATDNDGKDPSRALLSWTVAAAKPITNKNDVVYVIGGNTQNSQTAAMTISTNQGNYIGVAPPTPNHPRSRIGSSGTFTPMLTVSGNYNYFRNLRWFYGSNVAANLTLLRVTGAGNVFEDCHFAGPGAAAEAAAAGYRNAVIVGSENYFKHCVFGVTSLQLSDADFAHVEFLGTGANASTNIFEDCLFQSWSEITTPRDIRGVLGASTNRFNAFIRCAFVSFSSNWAVVRGAALKVHAQSSGMYMLKDCSFYNYTDVQDNVGASGDRIWLDGAAPTAASSGVAVKPT